MRLDYSFLRVSAAGCLVALLVLLLPVPGHADAGLTVGVALSRLTEQVSAAVTSAATAGNSAGMEAGRDLALAISATQNVYEEDLNKQLEGKIPPALKATMDQLGSAVKQLEAMNKASLQVAATSAEQVSNSLPYRPQEPKVVRFTPRFLVPAKDTYLVTIKVAGSFEFAGKPEFFPTLMIHEHSYKPVASSSGELSFAAPINDIFPADPANRHLQYLLATLKVPWQVSSLMGKKHTRKEDSFRLVMNALPSGPGTVKFMGKSTRMEGGKAQRHTGVPLHQCSGRSCGNGDDINHLWSEAPSPGCTIVKGTSSLDVRSSSGEWKKEFLGDAGDSVTYSVSTIRRGAGSSVVDFSISFSEVCAKEVANNVGEDVPLGWGESRTIPGAAGSTWKVTLDSFDGGHTEFTDEKTVNPLLKVSLGKDGALVLATPDPATLVWP